MWVCLAQACFLWEIAAPQRRLPYARGWHIGPFRCVSTGIHRLPQNRTVPPTVVIMVCPPEPGTEEGRGEWRETEKRLVGGACRWNEVLGFIPASLITGKEGERNTRRERRRKGFQVILSKPHPPSLCCWIPAPLTFLPALLKGRLWGDSWPPTGALNISPSVIPHQVFINPHRCSDQRHSDPKD